MHSKPRLLSTLVALTHEAANVERGAGRPDRLAIPLGAVGFQNSLDRHVIRFSSYPFTVRQGTLGMMPRAVGAATAVLLYRKTISTGGGNVVVSQQLADTGGAYRAAHKAITTLQDVDNQRYAFVIEICLNSTSSFFRGARIAYTYAHAGD
jgi:hypothetical protein